MLTKIAKSLNEFLCKIWKKLKLLTKNELVTLILWLTTFVFLITFVVLAATLNDKTEMTRVQETQSKLFITSSANEAKKLFGKELQAPESIYLTWSATPSSDTMKIVDSENISQAFKVTSTKFEIKEMKHLESYANVLASVGFIFAAGLFSALTTTILFARKKREVVK